MRIHELIDEKKFGHIKDFSQYCLKTLNISHPPKIRLVADTGTAALGYFNSDNNAIVVTVKDRHQMDIMRTLAHEIVHYKQTHYYEPDGATGSYDENQANALAGVLMRKWGSDNPHLFRESVEEASYPGNIGAMEISKFFQVASEQEKNQLKQLVQNNKSKLAWKLIQQVTGIKLQGDKFSDVDEGWKSSLAGAALAAGMTLGGGNTAQASTYTIQPGDTIYSLSKKHNVPVDVIAKTNKLDKNFSIKVGQNIKIPDTAPPTTAKIPPQATNIDAAKPADKSQTTKKPTTSKPLDVSKTVTGTMHEALLKYQAERAGIKGTELAAFLSQCAHETMNFKRIVEFGGSLDFRKYDPKYAPNKAKALGNIKPGDGAKYKGRGYIQLTGRYNYKRAGEALGLPLEQNPELVEQPEIAAKVAVWFWKQRVQPKIDNFKDVRSVTKTINPGLKGLEDRKEKFLDFKLALTNQQPKVR